MCILCSEPTVRYSVAEPFLVEQKFDGGYLRKRSRLNKNTNTCCLKKIYTWSRIRSRIRSQSPEPEPIYNGPAPQHRNTGKLYAVTESDVEYLVTTKWDLTC